MTIQESINLCGQIEDEVDRVGDSIAQLTPSGELTASDINVNLTSLQTTVQNAPCSVISNQDSAKIADKIQDLLDSNYSTAECEDLQNLIYGITDKIQNEN